MNISISEEDLKNLLMKVSHLDKQVTELQNRGTELLMENRKLLDGIRYHRDQKRHDRCWLDDIKLYELLPEGPVGYDPTLPPEEEFLENCKRYCDSRQPVVLKK